MQIIKAILEFIAFLIRNFDAVCAKVKLRPNGRPVLLAMVGVGVPVMLLSFVYFHLTEAAEDSHGRVQHVAALTEEIQYQDAHDWLITCIDARREKSAIARWYCHEAVAKFISVSTRWQQDRVRDLVSRHAYAGMVNEVDHYLRSTQVGKVINSPTSEEKVAGIMTRYLNIWVLVAISCLATFAGALKIYGPWGKSQQMAD